MAETERASAELRKGETVDMRKILFRGKRVDNGEWVYGNYCEAEMFDNSGAEYFIIENSCDGTQFRVDPATVGQYTENDDVTGRKIFDGDIVKNKMFPWQSVKRSEEIGIVEFYKGVCCVKWNNFQMFGRSIIPYVDKVEVVGNIHENSPVGDIHA